ncbi:MAG: hypothetical protein Q7R51_03245 [bacterium]|nr:hypothetical protein [bacterium]
MVKEELMKFLTKFLTNFYTTLMLILALGFLAGTTRINSVQAAGIDILTSPMNLAGNNGAVEKYQKVDLNVLKNSDAFQLTYDLHGLCALPGDASAIIFDQNGWRYISLSNYGQNCKNGSQTVNIPLSAFGLNPNVPLTGSFHTRFWYSKSFTVDITSAVLISSVVITPAPIITPTPAPVTPTPTPIVIPTPIIGAFVNFLTSPMILTGNNGAVEKYQKVDPNILKNSTTLQLTYNLHGMCALGGDASAIIFDQNGWRYISLSNYGQNCKDGVQTVNIPLASFSGLNPNVPLTGSFHTRFWYSKSFTVDITSATLVGSTTPIVTPAPITTPAPTPIITPTPAAVKTWAIQSIDAMKDTKDTICGQRSDIWINQFVGKAVELGANYVAISTPYDSPSCGNSTDYARRWVQAIRARGLNVWHRHMPLSFEGIYSVTKNNSSDYLNMISNYIKSNPDLFQPGDIFTPIPEPQNGGISGVTYCAAGVCQFSSKESFNLWLRNAMTISNNAFQSIGKTGMKIGYFGFDGFVAWGDNNPDWHGILEDSTIAQMGNITIDHYPELIGDAMANDLNELKALYPNIPIIIGEWGTVTGQDVQNQVRTTMAAAKNAGVQGFNYWQFGPGGAGEQLINSDFANRIQFKDVQNFFKGLM